MLWLFLKLCVHFGEEFFSDSNAQIMALSIGFA
jgi:hypothetical protein